MSEDDSTNKLENEIADLEARLADLKARLPAHSIPPAMIAELDDLDELLAQAHGRLADLSGEIDKRQNSR